MDTQLRKGLLELCVLAVLREHDSYGYQIIKEISEYIDISESTLYPILRRLESEEKVVTYNTQYNNRIRKYHKISEKGLHTLEEFSREKETLIRIIDWVGGNKT
ncbi:MAG: PadR family transcriptional regulator [Eubacteriales bacterium]|nr:PadR family transcriptional regulator [Lachnospiraceae bacterium]MDO5126472.1 PadR family transcriptional regulator [Eubacteriales bacterium]